MAEFLSDLKIIQEVFDLSVNTVPQDGILLGEPAKVLVKTAGKAQGISH
jgi:hypothetical protein